MEDFLALDGLDMLLTSLELQLDRKLSVLSDVIVPLECVAAVRAVLNSHAGLRHFLTNADAISSLAKGVCVCVRACLYVCVCACMRACVRACGCMCV